MQREKSEDPRQQLFSAFVTNSKKNNEVPYELEETEEEDQQETRKNPHEPIPAFTSLDIAKKLRYRSEDRYINDRMEKELKAYKVEIEKRFQKSKLNEFKFPRIQRKQPEISPDFFTRKENHPQLIATTKGETQDP